MMPRWVARPPGPYRATRQATPPPYPGPPRYHAGMPRWGFPPVVWVQPDPTVIRPAPPAPRVGLVIACAALTVLATALAGGAEIWRYVLLIRGRDEVLPASQVLLADDLVLAAGLVALLTGAATVLAAVSVLGRLTEFAAHRAGLRVPRDDASRLLRLLVPGFNLYGAGQVLAEVDTLLRRDREDPSGAVRPGRVVSAWWLAWLVNGLVAVAVVVRTRMAGLQAESDAVLLHAVLNLCAMVVAGLTIAVFAGFRSLARAPRERDLTGWVQVSPA